MTNYRIQSIDLSTRITIAVSMLTPIPQRAWGYVTQLAADLGVSRTWLYELRNRVVDALSETLSPQKPGPQAEADLLVIDRAFIQRAITLLPVIRGSIRGIQEGLDLLFDVERSVGYISKTLQQAGEAASVVNTCVKIPLPVLAEADEIFQGKSPCLTVVDGRSFLVLNLSAEEKRDATTWGCTFIDLQQRGIEFVDVASDGAAGIKAGVREAELSVPLRLDWFHVLREAKKISARLETQAYRAIECVDRARRAEKEAKAKKRRPGRPLKIKIPLSIALVAEPQAIDNYDQWVWLLDEVQKALEPVSSTGELTTKAKAQETVNVAAELMQTLPDKKAQAFGKKLLSNLETLVSPIGWLETHLAPAKAMIDPQTESIITWAWQRRDQLGIVAGEGFDEALQPIADAFWEALELFHRTSSIVESLHSWLRPYLVMHRGMPNWLLSLLTLTWNHREFQRGKRAGKTPLELAGVENAPSLKEVISQLFTQEHIDQAA